MPIVRNLKGYPLYATDGHIIPPGQTHNVNTENQLEAAWLADGAIEVVDNSVPAPLTTLREDIHADISDRNNGDILVWDEDEGTWVNTPNEGGGGSGGDDDEPTDNPLGFALDGTDRAGNTAKLQEAIDDLVVGTIHFPRGLIALNPMINRGNGMMHFRGAGEGVTILTFPQVSAPASEYERQHAIYGGANRSVISDMTIEGPHVSNTLGQKPAELSGVHLRDAQLIERCRVYGFYANINIFGNHQGITDVKSTEGYYNLYWGPGAVTGGDQTLQRVDLTGCMMASLAVSGDNYIDACAFTDVHVGFGPVGILLEPKGTHEGAISNSIFNDFAFESIGERMILDQGMGNAGTRRIVGSVRWVYASGGPFDPAYRRSGQAAPPFAVEVGVWDHVRIEAQHGDGGQAPFAWPGEYGEFAFGYCRDFVFEGAGRLLENCKAGDKVPVVTAEGYFDIFLWDGAKEYEIREIGAGPTTDNALVGRKYDGNYVVKTANALDVPLGLLDAGFELPNNFPGPVQRRGMAKGYVSEAVVKGDALVMDPAVPGTVKKRSALGDKMVGYAAAAAAQYALVDIDLRLGV